MAWCKTTTTHDDHYRMCDVQILILCCAYCSTTSLLETSLVTSGSLQNYQPKKPSSISDSLWTVPSGSMPPQGSTLTTTLPTTSLVSWPYSNISVTLYVRCAFIYCYKYVRTVSPGGMFFVTGLIHVYMYLCATLYTYSLSLVLICPLLGSVVVVGCLYSVCDVCAIVTCMILCTCVYN